MIVDGFDCSRLGHSHPMFDLGEHLFDWIEVGRVRWEKCEFGIGCEDCVAYGVRLVASQVVENDDVTRPECGNEELFDISAKDDPVDRTINDARFSQCIDPKGCQERQRAPTTVWCIACEARALRTPAAQRRHIGFDPRLINEDKTLRSKAAAGAMPAVTPSDDIRPSLLTGEERFF